MAVKNKSKGGQSKNKSFHKFSKKSNNTRVDGESDESSDTEMAVERKVITYFSDFSSYL